MMAPLACALATTVRSVGRAPAGRSRRARQAERYLPGTRRSGAACRARRERPPGRADGVASGPASSSRGSVHTPFATGSASEEVAPAEVGSLRSLQSAPLAKIPQRFERGLTLALRAPPPPARCSDR